MTRLIDADDLIKKFLNCCRTDFEIRNCCMTNENVIHIISNAPTVEERSHGEWVYEEHGYMICSNCGYECSYNEEGMYLRGSYCYNCGAYMREAKKNDAT